MDFSQIFNMFTGMNIIFFFFKAFAIAFSFMYLFYAIIITRETQVLNKTLIDGNGKFVIFITFLQIFSGLLLILLAIFFV